MNNPPAFPTYEYQESYGQMMAVGGMTLRDYFAAKAMQGIQTSKSSTDDYHIAKYAYKLADEMLKARKE
jgi:hypothetical protein